MQFQKDASRFRFPWFYKTVIVLGGVLAGLVMCRIFIVPFTVSDDSMRPQFKRGDRVYVVKHVTPVRGDVVLFHSPLQPDRVLLKRIIAADGDVVEIREKVVYLNNKKNNITRRAVSADTRVFPLSFSRRDNLPAVTIGRKMFFVIGDNIDYSFDSRSFGPISAKSVIGRVLYKL